MSNSTSGYLFGLIFSTVAAVAAIVGVILYFRALLITAFMSLGRDDNPLPILLLMLGGYLLIAAVLAVLANRIFNSRTDVAFLINVAPLVVLVSLLFLWREYRDYTRDRNVSRSIQTAIDDAPAIHLGELYVKKVGTPTGGVTFYVHVPFTVDRTIRANSLTILITTNELSSDIQYSSRPECNSASGAPTHGFHIVDREYTGPSPPIYRTGREIVSDQLHPGKQYYLLRELYFGHSLCRISDYDDFDPKQLRVTVDVNAARQGFID